MSKRADRLFKLYAIYDTETTNIGSGVNTRAFPILFIFNNISNISLTDYYPDHPREQITFKRTVESALAYIESAILYGRENICTPIIAAYNLMFDLKPLMFELSQRYQITACATSSTNAYYVDLLDDDGKIVLRFWDTYHLERNGLAAMGQTCGIAKATGDWDYSLVRTPDTPLIDDELYYAKRDVQVIPAYLRYLLEANEFIAEEELGNKVLTKTSIVRQLAKKQIGRLRYKSSKGKSFNLGFAFNLTCLQELPYSFASYGLRKACFRGGFTFTAANYASKLLTNVTSLDVTSMHHTFINGFLIPVHFAPRPKEVLQIVAENIVSKPISSVLRYFQKPFSCAIHAKICFTNLRLKKDSVFEKAGIACLPQSKFSLKAGIVDFAVNERAQVQEEEVKESGWVDECVNPTFAFSKLIQADTAIVHVNELELWNISQVYEWDKMEVILGESTTKFITPPDYVTLQSNLLFQRKNEMKKIVNTYKEGKLYENEIGGTIPEALAEEIKKGSVSLDFLNAYYSSTVKGSFNSIFGANAQDIYKPDFIVGETGDLAVDANTKTTNENWDDKQPNKCAVLYTYGMRIVGGSRMHLIIAMQLLHNAFGNKIKICGGDTDSIKMSCSKTVKDKDILNALEPLHNACDKAINFCQKRIRRNYPDYASTLHNIGHFDIEITENKRYKYHIELWNKARFSIDQDNKPHVTMAGLSRPYGQYNILNFIEDVLIHNDFKSIWKFLLGYNTIVDNDICHALEHHLPKANEKYEGWVTDYLGNKSYVSTYQSIALYPADRFVGDTEKLVNYSNVEYLHKRNVNVNTALRTLKLTDGEPHIYFSDDDGYEQVL